MQVDNDNDNGSKPMKDYNKASSMQLKVIQNGFDNLVLLNDNIKLSGNQLRIADLGCSHGKNSMIAINQLLDLIEKNDKVKEKLTSLLVFHEDLNDNDFNQVQNCLDDKSISYLNHNLITAKNISTEVQFLPKSFYESLFEPGTIDVVMCYTAIHWLPKYKSLTRGLWFREHLETQENIEWFKKVSKECLVNWLSLRLEELSTNGLITMNIYESTNVHGRFNSAWDEYLATKGFSHVDLNKVNLSGILRSVEEVNECLEEFKGKFRIIRNYHSKEVYEFGRDHLNAVIYSQVFHGLGNYPDHFPTSESKNDFIKGYLDYYFDIKQCSEEMECGYIYLVLQKI